MAKPRPIEVHANSQGKKHHRFQELMHSVDGSYAFVPVDGPLKTQMYNKGFLDARKQPISFQNSLAECEYVNWVAAFSTIQHAEKIHAGKLTGLIQADQLLFIEVNEVNNFFRNVCQECELCGESNCFLELDYDCAKEDRDRYRDGSYFEYQKEIRKNRRYKTTVSC